jgi:hypothetical protein
MSFPSLSVSLDVLDTAVAEIEAADIHLRQVTQEARQRLKDAVAALGRSVRSLATDDRAPAERDALARRLYWDYRRVPVREIVVALGFTGQADLLDAVGTVDTGVPCDDCGRSLWANTRSRLNEILPSARRPSSALRRGLSCPDCVRLQRAAEAARWARAERAGDDGALAEAHRLRLVGDRFVDRPVDRSGGFD